jgi:hypothetical protein
VIGEAELSTPDSESEHEKLTVTSVLFQPFAFAAGDCDALTVGAVLSILMLLCVALAELPALSVQDPEAD